MGTATSFEAFFRAEHPKLMALGWALTGDTEVAGDLVQESLLRAYRAWPTVADYDNPGAWVRRVLTNLATDRHRRRRREQAALARIATDAVVTAIEPSTDRWWQAVRALPDRQRVVVALHYLEDMSVDDVAMMLGVSAGTVKTQLSRARQSLARTLAEEKTR